MALADMAAKAVKFFVPTKVLNRLAPQYEPANLSSTALASTIKAAISSSESGDPLQLFSLYRDMTTTGSHVQTELNKRKLAVVGDTLSIVPYDKTNADDKRNAEAVARMIEDCENWSGGLSFLLDSSAVHPLSIVEAIWQSVEQTPTGSDSVIPRFTLKKLSPVNYALLTFRPPVYAKQPATAAKPISEQEAEVWEPDVRIYPTDPATGQVVRDMAKAITPDPQRHLVHRGHLLYGIPDKWGGPGRAILAWWWLAQSGRDWFARYMEKFGTPFLVGKTNQTDTQALTLLRDAFATASKIGGIVVSEATEIELTQAATSGASDAYERFLAVCHREISKVIVGQELSSTAAATGLGSGVAKLQGQVRDDIRIWDQKALCETLCRQLIRRFMFINAFSGRPPKLVWGTLSTDEASKTGALLVQLKNAGLRPTDEAIEGISEKVGIELERIEAPEPIAPGAPGQPLEDPEELATMSAGRLINLSASQGLLAYNKGVPASWLAPVAKELAKLERLAMDDKLSDAELFTFLDLAVRRIPELFPKMDVEGAAKTLEAAMVREVISEARKNLRKV